MLLRALLAPLLLVASVILSFAAALGIGVFVFDAVFGFPGVDPALPLLRFVFLVALGIDYNIFLMARVREETLGHGTREGMLRGLAVDRRGHHVGGHRARRDVRRARRPPARVLTEIGFIVAFGVLLDTFIVRSCSFPRSRSTSAARIWWPSRLHTRTPGDGTREVGARAAPARTRRPRSSLTASEVD